MSEIEGKKQQISLHAVLYAETRCQSLTRASVVIAQVLIFILWLLIWDAEVTKAFLRIYKKVWKTTQQLRSFTCRGTSSFGFHFLLGRRWHVCSDPPSAARRNQSVRQTKTCFILPLIDHYTSDWIVNVAFSWALFGNDAWWRHRGPSGVEWREERNDVGRSLRV